MDLFQQQMNRKDEHVGHANQQYRATSAPEFVETRFVHHPFTTVDVADVSLQTKLAGLTLDVPFFINSLVTTNNCIMLTINFNYLSRAIVLV